jgi:hypothetical protein
MPMKNPRSVALRNANPRLLTSPNADVLLSASTPIFHVNNSGIPSTNTITLNASLIAMEGTVTFTCEGGTLSNIVGNTCALNYETLTGDNAKVIATITYRNKTYTDTVEISKVYDGQNGVVGMNNAVVYAYQRSATQPTGTPGAVTYSFTARAITNASLSSGWQKILPSGTGTLWITAATAASSGSSDDIAANEWSGSVILAQDGTQGTNGINSAAVTIYQRTATTTAPALPSAATTYTFNPPGLTGLTNGWTTTLPNASAGKYLWASTATAANTAATDSIPASEWAAAQMLVQDGAAGTRGNVQVARAIPGSVWSDSEAALAISGAGYGTPQNRDIVTLYNNSANYSQQKYYDGAAWQALAAYFPGGVIVDGTMDATALKAKTITGDKIAARAITATSINVSGNSDNIIPDPRFKDLVWWGRVGSAVGQFAENGQVTGWKGGASLYLSQNSGELISYSQYFDLIPGATYLIEVQVGLSSDFNGRASVYLTIPGDRDYAMVDRSAGQVWSDNLPVQLNASSPKGIITYSTTYTIPTSGTLSKARIQIRNSHTVGIIEVGSASITRVSDSVLIKDGAVTANKISVVSLSAINVDVGFLTSRAGGPGAGYGAGTEIQKDQIRIYDEAGNLRLLDGRLN